MARRMLESGLSAGKRRAVPQDDVPSAQVPADLTTVGDLLGWVGDDLDRAQLVLEQESAKDHPRKTLTEPLATLILEA